MPVTVRVVELAVLGAASGTSDAQLRYYGHEARDVTIVGVVENVETFEGGVEFKLNDSSGRLCVRHHFLDGVKGVQLQDAVYVRVMGEVRTSPHLYLGASHVWLVTADDIARHIVEVIYVSLKLHRMEKEVVVENELVEE